MIPKNIQRDTIFLTITGSHAYGLNTPQSDLDYVGICIPREITYYMGSGINSFEQYKAKDQDLTIYDLRKAIRLMEEANPNMLELLFIDERFHQKTSNLYKHLRSRRYDFLSKKVRHTYSGYAFAQMKRIRSHRSYLLNPPGNKPQRSDFGLPDNEALSNDLQGAISWLLATFLKDNVQYLDLSKEVRQEIDNLNFIGLVQSNLSKELDSKQWGLIQKTGNYSDSFMDLLVREKQYRSALQNWTSYQNWKAQRNPKRKEMEAKFGYDPKFAMHAVRLARTGLEILEFKDLKVLREYDKEELLEVRNGAWSFEKLEETMESYEKRAKELYLKTTLPDSPDYKKLDELCSLLVTSQVLENKDVNS